MPCTPGIRRVFSGIQPTGIPHLGNYLGALRQWVQLQNQVVSVGAPREAKSHELEPHSTAPASRNAVAKPNPTNRSAVIYSIVDLHALTALSRNPAASLRESVLNTARALLAVGIDPQRSILFQQSQVVEHSQLQWVLSCLSSMGWLTRMTQWKSKAGNPVSENQLPPSMKLGLYAYPVLQAADILIYKASHVPVGEDQHQHLELARDIAKAFNATYGPVFPLPQAISQTSVKRIMALTDPTSKMSKSHPQEGSRIHVTDSDEDIARKIKRAVTDSEPRVTWDPLGRPGVANLLSIYAGCVAGTPGFPSEVDAASLASESNGVLAQVKGMARLKDMVTEVVVQTIRPIREEYQRLEADPAYVQEVLRRGNAAAKDLAKETWQEVAQAVGINAC